MNRIVAAFMGILAIALVVVGIWALFFKPSSSTTAQNPLPTPVPEVMPTTAPTTDLLTAQMWQLTQLGSEPVLAESTITAQFTQEGTLSGSDGCNQYTTTYTVSGSTLTVGEPIASTKRACPTALESQTTAFYSALTQANSFSVTSESLTLTTAEGESLVFAPVSTSLSDTNWEVVGYNNGNEAVVSVILGTTITANFSANNTISGSGGCNSYNGSYTTSGDSIAISNIASTLMLCMDPEGASEQETQYFAALQSAATYTMFPDKMEFRTASGALAVSFIPATAAAQ